MPSIHERTVSFHVSRPWARMALMAFLIVAGAASPALGQTYFTNAQGDNDFNNPANWTNGLPRGNEEMGGNVGYIGDGLTATLTAGYTTTGGGGANNSDIYVGTAGTTGSLNTGPFQLYYGAGLQQGLYVGVEVGSAGTVNIDDGGELNTGYGGANELTIGRSDGQGTGRVNVWANGSFGIRGGIKILNGTLWFHHLSDFGSGTGDDLTLRPVFIEDTLSFSTDGPTINTFRIDPTHARDVATLNLGPNSTLLMELGGTFNIGDSWVVIQDYEGLNGTFGTVIGTNGETFTVDYAADVPGTLVSGPNDIVITLATVGGTSPTAPSNLTASPLNSQIITLNWTDNAANETGFEIERKEGAAGTYAPVTTVGPNIITYSDVGLNPETTYFYRVRAVNAAGQSAWSNEASATTPASSLRVRRWDAYR